jgi:hypothetical protein
MQKKNYSPLSILILIAAIQFLQRQLKYVAEMYFIAASDN